MSERQTKLIEMQILEQDLSAIQRNLQAIDQQLAEIDLIKNNLDEFSKLKKDSDSLMALANGIFAKGKITDNKELFVNVGANTIVKKSVSETKSLLDEQSKELERYRNEAIQQLNDILSRIENIKGSLREAKE